MFVAFDVKATTAVGIDAVYGPVFVYRHDKQNVTRSLDLNLKTACVSRHDRVVIHFICFFTLKNQ